jgi:hypothetical protein
VRNHKGATNFSTDIHTYLRKEKSYHAVVGSFKANPFIEDMAISPLNSVPKKDSLERRVIVDLSFPEGLAVYQPTPQYYSPAIIFQEGQRQNYNNVLLHNQPNHLNQAHLSLAAFLIRSLESFLGTEFKGEIAISSIKGLAFIMILQYVIY